jgi:hypothetical protein
MLIVLLIHKMVIIMEHLYQILKKILQLEVFKIMVYLHNFGILFLPIKLLNIVIQDLEYFFLEIFLHMIYMIKNYYQLLYFVFIFMHKEALIHKLQINLAKLLNFHIHLLDNKFQNIKKISY